MNLKGRIPLYMVVMVLITGLGAGLYLAQVLHAGADVWVWRETGAQ